MVVDMQISYLFKGSSLFRETMRYIRASLIWLNVFTTECLKIRRSRVKQIEQSGGFYITNAFLKEHSLPSHFFIENMLNFLAKSLKRA